MSAKALHVHTRVCYFGSREHEKKRGRRGVQGSLSGTRKEREEEGKKTIDRKKTCAPFFLCVCECEVLCMRVYEGTRDRGHSRAR